MGTTQARGSEFIDWIERELSELSGSLRITRVNPPHPPNPRSILYFATNLFPNYEMVN